jgi:hypothetical protein
LLVLYIITNVYAEGLVATEGKPVTVRTYVRVIDPSAANEENTSQDNTTSETKVIEDNNFLASSEENFFDILGRFIFVILYQFFSNILSIFG